MNNKIKFDIYQFNVYIKYNLFTLYIYIYIYILFLSI